MLRFVFLIAAHVTSGIYFQATQFWTFLQGMFIAGLAQTIAIQSFWVARSAGYRVVRQGMAEPRTAPDISPISAHPLD